MMRLSIKTLLVYALIRCIFGLVEAVCGMADIVPARAEHSTYFGLFVINMFFGYFIIDALLRKDND